VPTLDASVETPPPSGKLTLWLLAARPRTLTAALVPVAVGSACAHRVGGFALMPALAALFGAFLIQIGTNFANDVFDHEKGADTEARVGPTRAVAAGLVSGRAMRLAMVAAFGMATLAGAYLAWVGGWPIVAIGIASIVSGIAYTGGPFPLGYHGLGDLFVMVFFGFVAVAGTAYVEVGTVPEIAWWASVPVGALATAILVVNNVRDRETDAVAGKRTLAVRFGRRFGEAEYGLLLLAAYVTPAALYAMGRVGAVVLLPVVTMPWALILQRRLVTTDGPALNALLGGTAQLLLVFGLLFAVGLAA
jgi:1,4-dihydroxy-2-naphthoate octaprenyltransferase